MKISYSQTYQWICSKMGIKGIRLWHTFLYKHYRHKKPNFDNPSDLSEYILGQMQKESWSRYADLADKVSVRDYIKSKGMEDILLDFYGAWEKAEDIDFDKLPEKFALKPNNGSGGHFFCKDKSKIDKLSLIPQMNKAIILERLGYRFEPHYHHIKPLIYAEELIDTGTNSWPTDYKFTCVKGKIVDIFVCMERESGKTKYITMDTEWNVLPYTKPEYMPKDVPTRPKLLPEMIVIAKTLCKDFDVVRVDLYEYKNKVYFSELTFSPWGGMMYSYNDEALKIMAKDLV